MGPLNLGPLALCQISEPPRGGGALFPSHLQVCNDLSEKVGPGTRKCRFRAQLFSQPVFEVANVSAIS